MAAGESWALICLGRRRRPGRMSKPAGALCRLLQEDNAAGDLTGRRFRGSGEAAGSLGMGVIRVHSREGRGLGAAALRV